MQPHLATGIKAFFALLARVPLVPAITPHEPGCQEAQPILGTLLLLACGGNVLDGHVEPVFLVAAICPC